MSVFRKTFFAIFFLSSGNLFAEPTINIQREDYIISGSNVDELRAAMNKGGPLDLNSDKRFDAYTKWYVKWEYEFRQQARSCGIQRVKVTVDVKLTLPKWKERDSAPQHLREKWDKYNAALQIHENGHKDLGINAAQEIEQSILSLNTLSSCHEMGNAANKTAYEILEHYKTKEITYDKTTRHGATQGATFP